MGAQIVNFRPSDDHEWTRWAECAKPGAPYMFPSDQDHKGIQLAKGVCTSCPVVAQCLASAIQRNEQHGVWGGLTYDERVTLWRRNTRSARRAGVEPKTPTQVAEAAALDAASEHLDGVA